MAIAKWIPVEASASFCTLLRAYQVDGYLVVAKQPTT
jgi:hypothetical protein